MIFNPIGLPDQQLEDVLLRGVRALSAGQRPHCADQVPRYAATAERRKESVKQLLECSNELMRRRAILQLRGELMDAPQKARDYFVTHFRGYEAEAFVVMFLDSQNRFIAVEEMFRGSLTQTSVYPREVVKRALAHNSGAVLLAHNHPSGSSEPSRADEFLTTTLKQTLGLVEVKVLDHIVVGAGTTTSFAERGLL